MRAIFLLSSLFLFLILIAVDLQAQQCSIQGPDAPVCADQPVVFRASGGGGASYQWDVDGDGQFEGEGAEFSYDFPGSAIETTYTVSLYSDSSSCASREVTIAPTPDPSIGVPADGGVILDDQVFRICTGVPSVNIKFFNNSRTLALNESYVIDWGDGSPKETFNNTTFGSDNLIEHTYNGFGFYDLTLTVSGAGGCSTNTGRYQVYLGTNPSVGLGNPGNTVGLCAPVSLTFPITGTQDNPAGTVYNIYVNGQSVASFTQENIPSFYTHTFTESSCGQTTSTKNYQNAFDLQIIASNPCGSSTATVEPIEISEPPEPLFEYDDDLTCTGRVITLRNVSVFKEVISGNPSRCESIQQASWAITPGTAGEDWVIVDGNLFGASVIKVEFNRPGTYTVAITVNSPSCGAQTFSAPIEVGEPPGRAGATAAIDGGNGLCAPGTLRFSNTSQGPALSYQWSVSPAAGWSFADGTSASSADPAVRIQKSGEYTFQLRASNACDEITWDTTIRWQGPPDVDLTPPPDACRSAVLNFDNSNLSYNGNGSAISRYEWSFPDASTTSSTEAFPKGIQLPATGTYYYSVSATNACGTTTIRDTVRVIEPTAVQMPAAQIVCISDGVRTLRATPDGGQWSGPGVSADGRFDPAAAGAGAHTLRYAFGSGDCANEGQVSVTVLAGPSLNLNGNPALICTSEPELTLKASPAGGKWTVNNGGSLAGNIFHPSVSGPGDYKLFYAYTDDAGCPARDSIELVVNDYPDIQVGDTIYCDLPQRMELPVARPAGGSWSGPGVSGRYFYPDRVNGPGNYTLQYSYEAGSGCTGSATIRVQVVAPAVVNAGPDASLCVNDDAVNLSGASPGGGRWAGRGIVDDTRGRFDPAAADVGRHALTYSVSNAGCVSRDTLFMTVVGVADLHAGPALSVCQGDAAFTLSGQTPAGGAWSGPGVVGARFDPALAGPGNYQLTYTLRDAAAGCTVTAKRAVQVSPNPTAAFALPEQSCIGDTVRFDNQTGPDFRASWDFGDGNTSGEQQPIHFYSRQGTFTVTLIAADDQGCADTTSRQVVVSSPPSVRFALDTDNGCAPLLVNFENKSAGEGVTYKWNFGNGQTSNLVTPGTIRFEQGLNDTAYVVTLSAANQCAVRLFRDTVRVRPLPRVDFGTAVDTSCTPMEVAFANSTTGDPDFYRWDLGNGKTSTEVVPPPQTYTTDTALTAYTITLIAGNNCGRDTFSRNIVVKPVEVSAFFNLPDQEGCAPFTVHFRNYATVGTSVRWDFGDGSISSATNPVHTYDQEGAYTVWQYATNGCGYDSTSQEVRVLPGPLISFEHPPVACIGEPVTFTNTSSNIMGHTWRFGNGDSTQLQAPVYTFNQAGTFSVALTGTSATNGCTATGRSQIIIRGRPVAAFQPSDIDGCAPLTIDFENMSQDGAYYEWSFGDGNSATDASPQFTYRTPGKYDVHLKVADAFGCSSDTSFFGINVYPVPEASFAYQQDRLCGLPINVTFENNSRGAVGYRWDLRDTLWTTSIAPPPTTFDKDGRYPLRLIVTNPYQCADTMTRTISIFPYPDARYEIANAEGCQPLDVQFIDRSQGNLFYWTFGDGTGSLEDNPVHRYEDPGKFEVGLVVSFDDLCFDTLELGSLVTVHPKPTADFNVFQDNDAPPGSILTVNKSIGALSYLWDFGDGQTSESFEPKHRYLVNGERTIQLVATNIFNCPDTALQTVLPPHIKGLFIPNAFSPESGVGDVRYFKPKGVGLKSYHVQVFSPYGELLWESSELNEGQPAEGWDGTMNGQLLPQDVYVWKVSAVFEDGAAWRGNPDGNGNFKNIGSVTLLR